MNIAIIDDESEDRQQAEFYLRKFIRENYPDKETEINIKIFSRARDMLLNFTAGQFDVMILDIRMKEITGMQAAKIVRGRGDDEVKIIFLTSSGDYMLDGYRVFATGYIMKPLSENYADFNKTFSHVFGNIFVQQKEILLRADRVEISVPYKNLCYADIDENHHLCVHLQERKIVTTMTYLECFEILSEDERFLECYHRIIVNMDFIRSMGKEDFTLNDGTLIPISQRKRKEVKAKYMHYLAHRN
ncbi:MAG: response regulator transcription factor [Selenomonadaceae bacterium]|nr:response regulator transcription factor [Selenomonadaceae bacterium]MBQ7630021.1 response regulator transcription factor [Selenomonadaceae bacterium]